MIPDSPFQVRLYPELDSTNEEAKRLLAQGLLQRPTILRAACQTAGRGTQGRQWFSPPGAGLYFSIIHPFDGVAWSHESNGEPDFAAVSADRLAQAPLTPLFTLAAGVACAETLASLTGLSIQLKPINDLYVEGRKLGGILTESLVSDNRCRALITGIGINVREHPEIEAGCAQEEAQRGNRPVSLQACIAPQLFNQWQPEAILEELSHSIALAVEQKYRHLATGQAQQLLVEYRRFKLPEFALPEGLEALLGALRAG